MNFSNNQNGLASGYQMTVEETGAMDFYINTIPDFKTKLAQIIKDLDTRNFKVLLQSLTDLLNKQQGANEIQIDYENNLKEEEFLDFLNASENSNIKSLWFSKPSSNVDPVHQQYEQEKINKEDDEDLEEVFGDLIKEFNELELAQPTNQREIKDMLKDAENHPLDGVLDVAEAAQRNAEDVSSLPDEKKDEEGKEGLYSFLDPFAKEVEEDIDDDGKINLKEYIPLDDDDNDLFTRMQKQIAEGKIIIKNVSE